MVKDVPWSEYGDVVRQIKRKGYEVRSNGDVIKKRTDALGWLLNLEDKVGEVHMTSSFNYTVSGDIEEELEGDC